jgi:hypothetical protein
MLLNTLQLPYIYTIYIPEKVATLPGHVPGDTCFQIATFSTFAFKLDSTFESNVKKWKVQVWLERCTIVCAFQRCPQIGTHTKFHGKTIQTPLFPRTGHLAILLSSFEDSHRLLAGLYHGGLYLLAPIFLVWILCGNFLAEFFLAPIFGAIFLAPIFSSLQQWKKKVHNSSAPNIAHTVHPSTPGVNAAK